MNPAGVRDTFLLVFSASLGVVAYYTAVDQDNWVNLTLRHYIDGIDAQLQALQRRPSGARIAAAQAVALILIACAAIQWGPHPMLLLALLPCAVLPKIALARARQSRIARIESSVTTFSISLANALKTSPSIGKALLRVQSVLTGPLAEELDLTQRELRLGTTVDQALLNLSARAQCSTLDVALSAVLIGRQVGGPIPAILETTAASFREMDRLTGVLRAKTADGKGQVWVMAASPAVIVFAFDLLQPGYFDPLFDDIVGLTILGFVAVSWAGSILLARKILAVEL